MEETDTETSLSSGLVIVLDCVKAHIQFVFLCLRVCQWFSICPKRFSYKETICDFRLLLLLLMLLGIVARSKTTRSVMIKQPYQQKEQLQYQRQ